jgi:hypothetical protein
MGTPQPSKFHIWLAGLKRALYELTYGEEQFETLLTQEHEASILAMLDASMKEQPSTPPMDILQRVILKHYPYLQGHERTIEKLRFHFARKRGLLQS